MENQKPKDFKELPGEMQRKMKKYYQHQIKKHPDVAVINIQEKVAKKFNVKFIQ